MSLEICTVLIALRKQTGVGPTQAKRSGNAVKFTVCHWGNCFYSRKYSRKYSARVISLRQSFSTVTEHIPNKRFQMVRYYGWYSNKMRGQLVIEPMA